MHSLLLLLVSTSVLGSLSHPEYPQKFELSSKKESQTLLMASPCVSFPTDVPEKSLLVFEKDKFHLFTGENITQIPRWNLSNNIRRMDAATLQKFLKVGYLKVKTLKNTENGATEYSIEDVVRGPGGGIFSAAVGYVAVKGLGAILPSLAVGYLWNTGYDAATRAASYATGVPENYNAITNTPAVSSSNTIPLQAYADAGREIPLVAGNYSDAVAMYGRAAANAMFGVSVASNAAKVTAPITGMPFDAVTSASNTISQGVAWLPIPSASTLPSAATAATTSILGLSGAAIRQNAGKTFIAGINFYRGYVEPAAEVVSVLRCPAEAVTSIGGRFVVEMGATTGINTAVAAGAGTMVTASVSSGVSLTAIYGAYAAYNAGVESAAVSVFSWLLACPFIP